MGGRAGAQVIRFIVCPLGRASVRSRCQFHAQIAFESNSVSESGTGRYRVRRWKSGLTETLLFDGNRLRPNVTNTFDRGYFSIKETITNVPRSSFSRCTAILKFCIFWSIFSDVAHRVRWKIYITFESFILTFFFSSEATRYKGKRRRHLFKLSSFPADNRVDKWKRSITSETG